MAALDINVARMNLVKAYRDLGLMQDSATVPTSTNLRRAEGRLNKALADWYESIVLHSIEVYRPTVTP